MSKVRRVRGMVATLLAALVSTVLAVAINLATSQTSAWWIWPSVPILTLAVGLCDHLMGRTSRRTSDVEESTIETCAVTDIAAHLALDHHDGRLPTLLQVPDDLMGPTPTRYTRSHTALYVARDDIDGKLRDRLRVKTGTFTFIVVTGPSKAGKSRTALEAARFVHPDVPLLVPKNGRALAAIAKMEPALFQERLLIWLDDLTVADTDHLTYDVFDGFCSDVILLCTMQVIEWSRIVSATSEVSAASRWVLHMAEEFELNFTLTNGEKEKAWRLYPEERENLSADVRPVSIAEVLVGGDQLWAKYRAGRDDCPPGYAVVQAAIDWQRTGLVRPCPSSILFALYSLYLPGIKSNIIPTKENFSEGVRWAAEPLASQVALLRPCTEGHIEPERYWKAFDYVVAADDGQGGRVPRPLPMEVWNCVLDAVHPREALAVGMSAHLRGIDEAELAAFTMLANSDDPDASAGALNVGSWYADRGELDKARSFFKMAMDSEHPYDAPAAALCLGDLLTENKLIDEARSAYSIATRYPESEEGKLATTRLTRLRETPRVSRRRW